MAAAVGHAADRFGLQPERADLARRLGGGPAHRGLVGPGGHLATGLPGAEESCEPFVFFLCGGFHGVFLRVRWASGKPCLKHSALNGRTAAASGF